jgi:hypothetical protein
MRGKRLNLLWKGIKTEISILEYASQSASLQIYLFQFLYPFTANLVSFPSSLYDIIAVIHIFWCWGVTHMKLTQTHAEILKFIIVGGINTNILEYASQSASLQIYLFQFLYPFTANLVSFPSFSLLLSLLLYIKLLVN